MRIRISIAIAVLVGLLTLTSTAFGDVVVVGSNANAARPFLGVDYGNLRTQLTNPANFGAGGVVPGLTFSFAAATPGGGITSAALSGVGIFVLTEPSSVSGAEAAVLNSYVRGGGSLVLVTDSAGNAGVDSVLGALDGGSLGSSAGTNGIGGAIVGSGLSTNGPFGNLSGSFGVSVHSTLNPGSASTVIGRSSGAAGTPILMEMLPGALGAGSGAVLAMGDVLLMDFFISPATLSANANNDDLALNWFAQAPGVAPVPEPSSLLMLGTVAIGLLWAAARKIRKA